MWLFIWNLIAMIGVLLIVFPVAAIHDYEERNKLNRKKLKIYLLLMIVPGIALMVISTCGLGIFDRLIIGALCLSPLLLIGLINRKVMKTILSSLKIKIFLQKSSFMSLFFF